MYFVVVVNIQNNVWSVGALVWGTLIASIGVEDVEDVCQTLAVRLLYRCHGLYFIKLEKDMKCIFLFT